MFSSSLASSAASGEPTGTTVLADAAVDLRRRARCSRRSARRRSSASCGSCSRCGPGRRARARRRARSPRRRAGRTPRAAARGTRAWCPGRSSTRARSSGPARTTPPSARAALSSGPSSGSRFGVSGVGTQIRIASASCRSTKRVLKRQRSSAAPSRSSDTSSMCERPRAQLGDLLRVDVDADDVDPRLGELHRQRQPDVAEPNDPDAHLAPRGGDTSAPSIRRRSSRLREPPVLRVGDPFDARGRRHGRIRRRRRCPTARPGAGGRP